MGGFGMGLAGFAAGEAQCAKGFADMRGIGVCRCLAWRARGAASLWVMEAGAVKTQATIERSRTESESATQAESAAPGERRRTPRFACEGSGEVIVLGGALRFNGEVLDLSATGCRIATTVMFTLERGTQVEVTLVVNRVHFRVAAGVRSNSRARGVGLEFMNVSARCARMIQELIAELAAKA